jgi:hypothetical protein
MLEMRPLLLKRCSAARSLYIMPSPFSAVTVLLSQIPGFNLNWNSTEHLNSRNMAIPTVVET